ncbi:Hypp664 [Branchiostoma lanceolatum]|uniref:Hypp664 protein n=1 Tax=Branchiostoma lanceolatum TaxID=7740 RepID=A0A8J9VVY4_BRALA|nr:Hypp664 [Branchiostoma lanceolatum]
MSEPAFRQHMVGKQLDFEMGDRLTCKRGTTTVGKVDGENMWIFNNEVHLLAREDERGVIVIEELSQKDQKYALLPTQGTIWTATITTPLSLGPMRHAVVLMREAFQHNFLPAIFVLGHSGMSMNAEAVASCFDCCPVTIAVGPSGLGKTMSLKTALSMIGIGDTGYLRQFKREAMMSLASQTTLGCFLDDPLSLESCKESVIDFYGMGTFFTLSRGFEAARCGYLMTANNPLQHHTERDLRRIIYIPFAGPKISDCGGHEERVSLKKMRDEHRLSACIKTLVLAGLEFQKSGWREVLCFQEQWAEELPGVLKDTLLNYGILLWFTLQFSAAFGVTHQETMDFWKENIVPYIVQYMQDPGTQPEEGSSVLDRVRADLVIWIEANPKEAKLKTRRGQIQYNKQGNGMPVDSLLVMNDVLKKAGSGISVSNIRGHLKATKEGLSETKVYKVEEHSKRFTVFKLQCFTQQQQATILNSLGTSPTDAQTDSNEERTEDETHSGSAVLDKEKATKRRQLNDDGGNKKKKKRKKKKTVTVVS